MSITTVKLNSIMAAQNTTVKYKSFKYDFNTDGGAQGVIGMGIWLGEGEVITGARIIPLSLVDSGGAAIISVGTMSTPNLVVSDGFDTFNTGSIYTTGFFAPAAAAAAPAVSSEQFIMTIADADLISGSFSVAVQVIFLADK